MVRGGSISNGVALSLLYQVLLQQEGVARIWLDDL